jgi:hypothetical protein
MGSIVLVSWLILYYFLGCLLYQLIKCFHIVRHLAAEIVTNSAVLI